MSRIGKLPIVLDKGVKATLADGMLKLEGPKGKLETRVHPGFVVEIDDSKMVVKRPGDTANERAVHVHMRKLVANFVGAADIDVHAYVHILKLDSLLPVASGRRGRTHDDGNSGPGTDLLCRVRVGGDSGGVGAAGAQ